MRSASEMLCDARVTGKQIDAIVIAADLRAVNNITALKEISDQLARIPKRIFLTDHKSRLSTVQAYALGATSVMSTTPTRNQLLSKLMDRRPSSVAPSLTQDSGREAAFAGAACIASMFAAVLIGGEIDIEYARRTGGRIADAIAEHGLSDWLATVRRHHEGTYQHCLLVTGVTVDFGLSLSVPKQDLERLYMAAMFHDIGKAKIPLDILDKRGRLDGKERALVETHPQSGYDALKDNPAISAEILDAVRHHHEFLDGSGYPDALCADEHCRPDADPDHLRHLRGPDRISQLQAGDAAGPGLRHPARHGRQAREAAGRRLPRGRADALRPSKLNGPLTLPFKLKAQRKALLRSFR